MSSVYIDLDLANGAHLKVEVPMTALSPVCVVKRAAAAHLHVTPDMIRLQPHGDADDVVLLRRAYRVSVREKATLSHMSVRPYAGKSIALQVDAQVSDVATCKYHNEQVID